MTTLAKNSLIGVRITTDYRAVAHVVEGLILLLFSILNIVKLGFYTSLVMLLIYAIFEIARGLLLLRDIINDNRNNLNWYMALSFVNFIVRHGPANLSFLVTGDMDAMQDSDVFVQVFRFFHEGVLFCYVLRFYWNVGAVDQKLKKENESSQILTRIFIDYRAVAHIVVGIIVCLVAVGMAIYFYFFDNTEIITYLFYGQYGIFECYNGSLLVRGIIKENRKNIVVYLVLSVFTLVVQMGLVIFGNIGFIYGIIIILYVAYQWFLFYCVVKFVRRLDRVRECERNGTGTCDDKLHTHNMVKHI